MAKRNTLRVGVAGAAAGSIEIVCTYPLEFAKTQLQLEHGAAATHTGFKRGTIDCLVRTAREHGVRGLYKGATPWFVFAGPRSAVRFATFEYLRGAAERWGIRRSEFACGLVAGAVEGMLTQTPMQAIQIKLVHDASPGVVNKRFAGMGFLESVAAIVRKDGFWNGLYCGVGPAVAKGAVTNGLRFFGYHGIVNRVSPRDKPSVALSMTAGGLAGAFSAVVSQPIDTVKANMMGLDAHRYKSSWDCAWSIIKADGLVALWNGVGPRTGRVFLEVGLQFSLFEQIFSLVDRIFDKA
ncbi:hypothetical protein CTAYLR_003363 [Chrysophaeum taylorii]|uniref:Uncharacterized protein n=1 Tax=Chrysophaeum taylorii TaxID=2483200 RepID=A0AAD7UGS9_9STRA|nr:hypothetical protein CTAYLR_003363 [Chrysophaeum taylorii]